MLAGLWLAPFVCETESDIFQNHKDWLRKDENGSFIKCGSNWSEFYALDLYNPDVIAYLENVFDTVLNKWGFDMVKLDFLYAADRVPTKEKTRGQQMWEAMELLRKLCGNKLILGCGVPLAPAFGKVDFCRIGCDVSLDWDDKPYMRIMHRERISTKNTICDSIYRRGLNGRAFLNDPDVFLLRDENIKLSKKQKNQLATVNGLFGSLWFTSDNCNLYTNEKKSFFVQVLKLNKAKNIKVTDNRKQRRADKVHPQIFHGVQQSHIQISTKSQRYFLSIGHHDHIRDSPNGHHLVGIGGVQCHGSDLMDDHIFLHIQQQQLIHKTFKKLPHHSNRH